jgi:hypothetical protein
MIGCKCGHGYQGCHHYPNKAVGQSPAPTNPIPVIFIVGLALIAASLLGGEQKGKVRP